MKEVATAEGTSGGAETATDTSLATEQQTVEPEDDMDVEEPAAKGQDVSYPEDPADDDDELEREMLAALEDGDYDAKAEEDIAAENG